MRIDWTTNGEDICRLVEQARPFGGAKTRFRFRLLAIWKARTSIYPSNGAKPSTITNVDDYGCASVALTENTLLVEELFRYGKAREADDFNFRLGERFK